MRKRKKKRIIPLLICVLAVYLIWGGVLYPLRHKEASGQVRRDFVPSDCYGEKAGTERVLNIEDNLDALLWRIRVIEAAEKELILSTFDFADDESGQDIMAALLHAADRGVHVQIIVDGINGKMKLSGSNHFKALTAHENVEAKFYNPIHVLLPWKMNLRLHDKYLIADDHTYILGGRNTNDLFLGNYREKYNVDRDLLVYETDPSDTENSLYRLRDYFMEIWDLSCNQNVTYGGASKKVKEAGSFLESRYDSLKETYPDAFAEADYYELTMETNRVTLLTNPPEPVNKEPDLWYMLHRLMADGQNIVIQTPYIVCDRKMYDDLTDLCGTAKVELIINAVEIGANPWGCTDYLNQKGKIRKAGIETYELFGEQSTHTKTILVDERLSMVGSYNLDMRSTYLDTEMMLAVDCEPLNRALNTAADGHKMQSRHVLPDGTSEYGILCQPKGLSFGKKLLYGVLRVIIIPVRHLL